MRRTANSRIPSIFDHIVCNSSTIKSNYHELFTTFPADTPDGKRFLQETLSQCAQLRASVSVSGQNLWQFQVIYHLLKTRMERKEYCSNLSQLNDKSDAQSDQEKQRLERMISRHERRLDKDQRDLQNEWESLKNFVSEQLGIPRSDLDAPSPASSDNGNN